ncbi:hypothetical protein VTK73DRAFT_9082 [Phialemonium thermophilum]|uniref:Major facilitator superfamily (MFS) profile domain-containing protein n=1 Tax=Phialemonium thermophilum TaxID=223376 RepID=A0ABR3W4Y0_9PEZI
MSQQIEAAPDAIAQIQSVAAAEVAAMPVSPGAQAIDRLDVHEPSKPRSSTRLFAILAPLYLVLFIAALDQTIVATAVPSISAALQSASGYTWIGGAYLLANAAASPLWAKASDIWGRKPALLAAVVFFAVASALAASAPLIPVLIAARALQGVAGGAIMQLVSVVLADLFSPRRRALYIGLLGLVWAVAAAAGPLVGGALTELAGWRWCFWINLPVCGTAFILLLLFLDVHNPQTKLREGLVAVDWFGAVSILAVTLLVLLGLNFGGVTFPWASPKVICLIAAGAAMIGFFLYSEKRLAKYPLMPLSMFKDRSTNAAIIVAFAHSMVSVGVEYYLPLYFQSVQLASPLRSGLYIMPMMVTEAATDVLSGILIHRTGRYREVAWAGALIMTLGMGLYVLAFHTDTPVSRVLGLEVVGGVGTALLFQTPLLAVQNAVRQSDTASATAASGLVRNLASALSVIVGGVVFQNGMAARRASLMAAGVKGPVLAALSDGQAAAHVGVAREIGDPVQRRAVRDAFAGSVRNIFVLYTCAAGVTVLVSLFWKHRQLRTDHVETKTGIATLSKREDVTSVSVTDNHGVV